MPPEQRIILCVDDDADDQMMVLETIKEIDPSVRVASALNGMEAMSFLYAAKDKGELPCLVIMDINMPLMGGKQAVALIKKEKGLDGVPIVLFTTSSNPLDKTFAAHHGVEFITKPINFNELKETVRRLLSLCLK